MYIEANGVDLYTNIHSSTSSDNKKTVILLHGMTLNGRDWKPVVKSLSDFITPITIDLIGHGRSEAPNSKKYYNIVSVVRQIRDLTRELAFENFHWIGYSMGGRILLQFACQYPELIDSMILESTTPGIEPSQKRKKRSRKDQELAEFLDENGLEAFVGRWLNASIFDSQQSVEDQKLQYAKNLRLQNDPQGIKNGLRELGRGNVPDVWDELSDLTMPIKLITGELDQKHCQIHEEMKDHLPNSSMKIIEEAGHNVHFENPEAYIRECAQFL